MDNKLNIRNWVTINSSGVYENRKAKNNKVRDQIILNLEYLEEDNNITRDLNYLGVYIDFPKALHSPLITSTALLINDERFKEIEDLICWWLYDVNKNLNVTIGNIDVKNNKDFTNYLLKSYK